VKNQAIQCSLFDTTEMVVESLQKRSEENKTEKQTSRLTEFMERYNLKGDPSNYASVYLVFFGTGRGNDIFLMTVEDAKKFCSSPKTKGQIFGGEFIFMWTCIVNLLSDEDSELNFKPDNGSQKKLLMELDITPLNVNIK